MPLAYNDGGTWRTLRGLYYNDGGTWRTIQAAWYNDGGTWRQVYTNTRHTGQITIGFEGFLVDWGYNTGFFPFGAYTNLTGGVVTGLFYDGGSSFITFTADLPGAPGTITVNVGGTAAAINRTGVGQYISGAGDIWNLAARNGQTHSVTVT